MTVFVSRVCNHKKNRFHYFTKFVDYIETNESYITTNLKYNYAHETIMSIKNIIKVT